MGRKSNAQKAAESAAGQMAETVADDLVTVDPGDETATTKAQTPPMFAVAERRLKHGDASMLRNQADFDVIGFDEPMATYWGLTEGSYDLINIYGWVPAKASNLPVKANMLGLTESPDGFITRGKNGSEMLFVMPKRLREEILHEASARRLKRRLSARTYKQEAANLAAQDAQNMELTPKQRESAARSAAALDSNKRAKWSFTEFQESHSRQPID